jgi:Uma2 family endonuclease
MSEPEYLRLEEVAGERSEYVDGYLRAMSGGTLDHGRVAMQAAVTLWNATLSSPCRVNTHDVKLRIETRQHVRFYYPDVMVACRPKVDDRWEAEPCLLIEVLSPSTQRTDVVEKLTAYCQIPSLEAYIVIDYEGGNLVVHRRVGTMWALEGYGRGDQFDLACPSVTISVDDWLLEPT